jgi:N-ethylmaleimide reductase
MKQALFEPTQLGTLNLKNRIVMAPLTRQRASILGVPKDFVVDYYAQRAGAGLIITEGTQPSFDGQGYCRTPGIHTSEQVAMWKKITSAVHEQGSRIFLQMMHAGRISHPLNRNIDNLPLAPSAIKAAGQIWTDQQQMQDHPVPKEMTHSDIQKTIFDFVDASQLAIDAGFDGVELHAANGYLLNQFLATNSNQRTDSYGGTVQNRIRFVVELFESVSKKIGIERTGLRISPGHMFNDLVDDNPLETHIALLNAIDTESMAYTHLMLPDSFNPALNNAGSTKDLLQTIRKHVKGDLIAAGNLTKDVASEMLNSNLIQLAVFGRPFISNPDFVERMKNNLDLTPIREQFLYTSEQEGYSDYQNAA